MASNSVSDLNEDVVAEGVVNRSIEAVSLWNIEDCWASEENGEHDDDLVNGVTDDRLRRGGQKENIVSSF